MAAKDLVEWWKRNGTPAARKALSQKGHKAMIDLYGHELETIGWKRAHEIRDKKYPIGSPERKRWASIAGSAQGKGRKHPWVTARWEKYRAEKAEREKQNDPG